MTSTVKFHSVPQNPENSHTVTIDLSPSNRSWLTGRNIVIGSAISLGITAIAVTAYFLSINNVFSVNTTETSTGYNTESSVNQSTLSLYNITQTVEKEPNYYANCNSAFEDHLKIFKICGQTLCACIRNARNAFELHCLDYAKNILKTPEECKEAEFRIQRCLEREC